MKKITLLLCSALLVLAACNKHQNEYTLNGHLDDAAFEGKMVYLYDAFMGTVMDSTTITNGVFTFKDTVSSPKMVTIRTNEEDMNYNLLAVLEPGTIYADLVTDSLSGTALNDVLHSFLVKENELGAGLEEDYYSLMMIEDEEEQKAAMQEFQVRYDEAMAEDNKLINQYYNENKTNILGVYFLNNMMEVTYDQLETLLQGAAPEVVNHPSVQMKMEMLKKLEATRVGQPYADIDVIDFQTGNAAKLSDYVAGKIALVDFWASWCRPCRGEIPNIANIYKKYGDKIVVISLNVWDKPESQAEAIQELNMNWIQLTDPTKNATEAYGVNGIPQIILIGADGTILARDLRKEAIEEAVVNALKGA
ncbi:MAG: AhpC/TSA family protein [Bacteroidales bacterium]|nr:AhpC/TSA family protein [Bacteroidales bacterium]